MRLLITLLLLSAYVTVAAQDVAHEWFNSPDQWQNTPMDNTLTIPKEQLDTCLIVASNRKIDRNDMRYMTEIREEGVIHYFFVYVNNGIWHVLPTSSLEAATDYLPNKDHDWVIYTEGMGKTFVGDLDRGIRMAAYFKVNVLLLDYPSISSHKKNLGNYIFAKRNAKNSFNEFTPVLDSVKRLRSEDKMGSGNITMFFHSMGNKVIRQVARHDSKLQPLNDKVWVNNLVLNAACVPERRHKKWLSKVQFARSVYVTYNPDDGTLYWAHFISFKKQLGEKVRKPLVAKAYYINFSPVVAKGHSNFLPLPAHSTASNEALEFYSQILHGQLPQLADGNKFKPSNYLGIGWDIIPQTSSNSSALISTH